MDSEGERIELDDDDDDDEINGDFDETCVNREKADAEELSGSRRVSDTFLRFSKSSSKSYQVLCAPSDGQMLMQMQMIIKFSSPRLVLYAPSDGEQSRSRLGQSETMHTLTPSTLGWITHSLGWIRPTGFDDNFPHCYSSLQIQKTAIFLKL